MRKKSGDFSNDFIMELSKLTGKALDLTRLGASYEAEEDKNVPKEEESTSETGLVKDFAPPRNFHMILLARALKRIFKIKDPSIAIKYSNPKFRSKDLKIADKQPGIDSKKTFSSKRLIIPGLIL
jgi:hypothetical protein